MIGDEMLLSGLVLAIGWYAFSNFYASLNSAEAALLIISLIVIFFITLVILCEFFSKYARDRRKRQAQIQEIPQSLLIRPVEGVRLGNDHELKIQVFLPDTIRMRHTHILGATGSGKTESVIINFLRQDLSRDVGSIVLDAKGDKSFLSTLKEFVPPEKLIIFDLGEEKSLGYNPLSFGSPLEAAQRLFSSLTWSEEYYKSKSQNALQKLFQFHFERYGSNPKLTELAQYLEHQDSFIAATITESYPRKLAEREFSELSGLRDQINILCIGHLSKLLSPVSGIKLDEAKSGKIIYFRLQSLLSPQIVSTLGKLLIHNLNYITGRAHRDEAVVENKILPVYFDEFASFACDEFADLISKARSAGLALHFSHQSIGDLMKASEVLLNQVTDNSATKIIMRINDPDSADYFARAFGTKIFMKITQRVTNAKDADRAEAQGEGSLTETHQFRANPDVFKTLPTGIGSVLIAHGFETPHGASTVFKIKFPKLEVNNEISKQVHSIESVPHQYVMHDYD